MYYCDNFPSISSEDNNRCKDLVDCRSLAHKALAKYNVNGRNRNESFNVPSKSYYFVDANGPVSSGYFRNLCIFHFNFLAKDKDKDKGDDTSADVETFFCEVSVDKHGSVTVYGVYRIGPTHTLPGLFFTWNSPACFSLLSSLVDLTPLWFVFISAEKANIYDCSYCLQLNIHHPQFRLGFRSGRADHLKSVVSKITCLDTYIKKW